MKYAYVLLLIAATAHTQKVHRTHMHVLAGTGFPVHTCVVCCACARTCTCARARARELTCMPA